VVVSRLQGPVVTCWVAKAVPLLLQQQGVDETALLQGWNERLGGSCLKGGMQPVVAVFTADTA
jgi:hypothetical protein